MKLCIVSILILFILTSRISSALFAFDINAALISLSPLPFIRFKHRFSYLSVVLVLNASAMNEHPDTLILLPSKFKSVKVLLLLR